MNMFKGMPQQLNLYKFSSRGKLMVHGGRSYPDILNREQTRKTVRTRENRAILEGNKDHSALGDHLIQAFDTKIPGISFK